jgi:hypothetical protein
MQKTFARVAKFFPIWSHWLSTKDWPWLKEFRLKDQAIQSSEFFNFHLKTSRRRLRVTRSGRWARGWPCPRRRHCPPCRTSCSCPRGPACEILSAPELSSWRPAQPRRRRSGFRCRRGTRCPVQFRDDLRSRKWTKTLATEMHGNTRSPKFSGLLFLQPFWFRNFQLKPVYIYEFPALYGEFFY